MKQSTLWGKLWKSLAFCAVVCVSLGNSCNYGTVNIRGNPSMDVVIRVQGPSVGPVSPITAAGPFGGTPGSTSPNTGFCYKTVFVKGELLSPASANSPGARFFKATLTNHCTYQGNQAKVLYDTRPGSDKPLAQGRWKISIFIEADEEGKMFRDASGNPHPFVDRIGVVENSRFIDSGWPRDLLLSTNEFTRNLTLDETRLDVLSLDFLLQSKREVVTIRDPGYRPRLYHLCAVRPRVSVITDGQL